MNLDIKKTKTKFNSLSCDTYNRVNVCLQKDGLEKLHPWISVVEDIAPEVLILVCDRVCENGEFSYIVWCLFAC